MVSCLGSGTDGKQAVSTYATHNAYPHTNFTILIIVLRTNSPGYQISNAVVDDHKSIFYGKHCAPLGQSAILFRRITLDATATKENLANDLPDISAPTQGLPDWKSTSQSLLDECGTWRWFVRFPFNG
jgi:hypothetical protein